MSYDLLSERYDELVRFDYDGLFAAIKPSFVPSGAALDLCSGTGTFALKLSEAGFKVTCVDNSPKMLTEAAKKARAARRQLLFLQSDVNSLKIYGKYSLITSTCDGFNYVKCEENLKKLFGKIHDALTENGVLAFDVSTLYKAENVLSGQTFFEDTPTYTLFWTARKIEDGKIGTDVSVFKKERDGYTREDGFFVQYFYRNETYKRLLEQQGFDVKFSDGETYGDLNEKSNRLLVVARKK